ncbi:LPS-assembly protein LptD [Verrucomicrobiota bacterium]
MGKTARLLAAGMLVGWAVEALGQRGGAGGLDAMLDIDSGGIIELVHADTLDYNRRTGWIEATGRVVLRKGATELRADFVRVKTETQDAYAAGNVVLTRDGQVWEGEVIEYNFATGKGDAAGFVADYEPFHVLSDRTEKADTNRYVMHRARITTCDMDQEAWHYHIRAKRVTIVPRESISANGATWYFGPIPVMYLPYWYRTLGDEYGFHLEPGYSSRMGAFMLSSYRYPLTPVLRGRTHVDYRSRRGVAFGQDVSWRDPARRWDGDVSGYSLNDRRPLDDGDDPVATDLDEQRYRMRVRHTHNMTSRDRLLVQASYLSDTDILEDFFQDEHRRSSQPDNYVSYTHRGDDYTASVIVRRRLNDFYSGVNRQPEAALDLNRRQIGDSPFYYEGRTAVAALQRVWAETDANEDYSAFRIDSSHMFYRPSRHFGFLNVTPRSGYRATYYSATLDRRVVAQSTSTAVTNTVTGPGGITGAVVSTQTNTTFVTNLVDGAADLRSLFEVGLETSFKAFRTWESEVSPRRHTVEPYANYTLVPEPDLSPNDLYSFDSVDGLGEEHHVRVGARNKYQTKRDGSPFDFVDADVYTIYRIHRDPDQSALETLYFDVELRPLDWLSVDLDGQWDLPDSEIDRFNTDVTLSSTDLLTAGIQHRFRRNSSSLLIGDVTLMPAASWSYNLYARHELDGSRFEEGGGYVQRNLDCMSIRVGGSVLPGYTRSDGVEREDEYRVLLEIWLTAFPGTRVAGRHRE